MKDGSLFRFDFRNSLESIFVIRRGEDREILAVGGSGGSSQREKYTVFTAAFHLLGKESKIRHHLLKYNSFNQYEYVAEFDRPIVTWGLGSNYSLDDRLRKEIRKNGVSFDELRKRFFPRPPWW